MCCLKRWRLGFLYKKRKYNQLVVDSETKSGNRDPTIFLARIQVPISHVPPRHDRLRQSKSGLPLKGAVYIRYPNSVLTPRLGPWASVFIGCLVRSVKTNVSDLVGSIEKHPPEPRGDLPW